MPAPQEGDHALQPAQRGADKKAAHGEPVPKNLHEQVKSGELKVPWTNAGS